MSNRRDPEKIQKMREAGKICATILNELCVSAREGLSLIELDQLAEQLCNENGVRPAFKGFEGYPATINANVNDIVVHGIPDEYELQDGDLLGIDFGIEYKGVFSDASDTVIIGQGSPEMERLINITRTATMNGVSKAIPGGYVGDIGYAIQTTVEKAGYSVVREMVGHGIGHNLHEDPYIPGYGVPETGEKLYDGQTIAIEAIVNQGSPEILISADDNWTTFTEDGMLSALFEHTVVVGKKPEVLTQVR